jgi:aminoglycoside phosphotransferase (APT) family kinase protein
MGAGAEISAEILGPWLGTHVPGLVPPVRLRKFPGGQSNPTWRLDHGGAPLVLRMKPPGPLLASAHQVDREFRVMAALAGTAVPVPRMIALATDDASPLGRALFVMEHLDGRLFWDPALPDLAPADRAPIYTAMAETLADLHALDPAALGLADFGRPGAYFARQCDRWARQYRASVASPDPRIERLIGWLATHLPQDEGPPALVHGDYRLDNMIFAADVPRVLGLLDWELSTLGPPLADIAYQCMQLRLPHDAGMRGLGGLDRAALCLPTEADYLATYCARRGVIGLRDFTFGLVFAFFRLAAILQGVVHRAETGNASNPDTARAYGRAIPILADMALDLTGEPPR